MQRADLYAEVTNRILAALEAGTVPWRKPWKSAGGLPVSLSTGRAYRGVNALLLSMGGFSDPRWGTYKAIGELGGQVRKGQKATSIVLWKPVKRKPKGDEDPSSYLFMTSFSVFNATQADGLPALSGIEEREFTPIELAEQIVAGYVWEKGSENVGPPVLYGYDGASYNLSTDRVEMPNPQAFVSDESFYSALFHELVHSSGGPKRLGRIEPALFGSDPYAREELVAELGASFLAGVAEFETAGGEMSAAYIANWMTAISSDPKLVITAASQAQKAADLILGVSFNDPRDTTDTEAEMEAVAA